MQVKVLPRRASNSPCIMCANFQDGTFINLIRLKSPYANGASYAISDYTKTPFSGHGMFTTLEKARERFSLLVKNAMLVSPLRGPITMFMHNLAENNGK